jgi:putative intracellular protease/amidase
VRVLLPLPDRDFDVTEVAVPWSILRDAGHDIVFATERAGTVPAADPLLLTGGHAPGMRQYLGSPVLRDQIARTLDPATGRSVLAGRPTTCLPKYMERSAYLATAWRLGRYYRTYPRYVEDEVRAALDLPDEQFKRGPVTLSARGTATDDAPAFAVTDQNYVSARWPGEAYLFARRFCALLTPGHNLKTFRPNGPDACSRAGSAGVVSGAGGATRLCRAVGYVLMRQQRRPRRLPPLGRHGSHPQVVTIALGQCAHDRPAR